jgi:hypothetical protein
MLSICVAGMGRTRREAQETCQGQCCFALDRETDRNGQRRGTIPLSGLFPIIYSVRCCGSLWAMCRLSFLFLLWNCISDCSSCCRASLSLSLSCFNNFAADFMHYNGLEVEIWGECSLPRNVAYLDQKLIVLAGYLKRLGCRPQRRRQLPGVLQLCSYFQSRKVSRKEVNRRHARRGTWWFALHQTYLFLYSHGLEVMKGRDNRRRE